MATVTKRDFVAVSRIIRETQMPEGVRWEVASKLAAWFGRQNQFFNRAMFLQQCGLEGSEDVKG